MRTTLLIVVAAAAAGGAYACWPRAGEAALAPTPAHVPQEPAQAPANGSPPAVGKLAEVPQPEQPTQSDVAPAQAKFPDGTARTALNGVTVPLTIDWPGQRPYSPVVEVVTNENGVSFWKHADGSFSTTLVRVETVSGKVVQFAQTYTPGPAPSSMQLHR